MERIFATTGNSLNAVKNDGFTTLHIAAISDHLEIAKILLKKVISSIFVTDFFFVQHSLCNLNCRKEISITVACVQSNREYDFLPVVMLG